MNTTTIYPLPLYPPTGLNVSVERFELSIYVFKSLQALKRSIKAFNDFCVIFILHCFQALVPFNEIIERFIERDEISSQVFHNSLNVERLIERFIERLKLIRFIYISL